jgi:hypothetical protein
MACFLGRQRKHPKNLTPLTPRHMQDAIDSTISEPAASDLDPAVLTICFDILGEVNITFIIINY